MRSRGEGVCSQRQIVLGLSLLLPLVPLHFGLAAQDLSTPTGSSPKGATTTTNFSVKRVGPGQYRLGQVRINKPERTVQFPAVLNMDAGIVEYLLVAAFGKTHESVLRTKVAPYQVHVAMLLLGARGAGTNTFPEQADQPLPGDAIEIETRWRAGKVERVCRAEQLVTQRMTQKPLRRGPWVYNGSLVANGSFAAQLDGSIVSLMTDPCALVNNPRPGHERDDLWLVRTNDLPPLETPITVTFKLISTNHAATAKPRQSNRPTKGQSGLPK